MGFAIYTTLLVMSVISWAIMIRKYLEMRQEKKRAAEFQRLFNELEGDIVALSQEGILPANSPARLFVAAYEELRFWATLDRERNCIVSERPVVPALERALDRAIEAEKDKWEGGLVTLATTATAGPLLGLLGTVWGVYISFKQMGMAGSATLETVAPGISEALLTTVAGLLVAIPAVFGYNGIMKTIRSMETQMEGFSQEIINRFDRQVVVEPNANRTVQQPMIRRKARVTS
ncbi:MAG: MotA/TolQ/ExbB proton channel family protein [bacterium]